GGMIVQHGLLDGTNEADLTLAMPGQAGSISESKTLVIATASPQVSSVTTEANNGTYGSGAEFTISVNFSKPVDVAGTPRLALNSDGQASYRSGTGTATLIFSYAVAAGNASADLDYSGANALSLNGGIIAQHGLTGGTNKAVLTLAAPGQMGSISKTKS